MGFYYAKNNETHRNDLRFGENSDESMLTLYPFDV